MLSPGSKKKAFDEKGCNFERFNVCTDRIIVVADKGIITRKDQGKSYCAGYQCHYDERKEN